MEQGPELHMHQLQFLGESGGLVTHWGCFFGDSYQRWVPQKLAKRKAVCTVPEERRKFPNKDVHWEPADPASAPKVEAKPLPHPERQVSLMEMAKPE